MEIKIQIQLDPSVRESSFLKVSTGKFLASYLHIFCWPKANLLLAMTLIQVLLSPKSFKSTPEIKKVPF
jgi:hypothetical protein